MRLIGLYDGANQRERLFFSFKQGEIVVADKVVAMGKGFDGFVEFPEFGGLQEAVAGGEPGFELVPFFKWIKGIEDDVIGIA